MSTQLNNPKGSSAPIIWGGVCLAVLGLAPFLFQTGANSPRIANPDVTGVPRPVEFLGGDWVTVANYGTLFAMVIVVLMCVVAWRRNPGSPLVLMAMASTAIVWQDPIMNWSPYAVYNPQLWHFPEDWFYVSLSPSVEPFIVIGYAMFYFGPYFPAIWLLKRMQAKRPMDAFVWRRPLVSLALLILVIGFICDAILEVTLVRTGLYIYSQVIPWGSLFPGTTFQFPLIWESTFVTFVMIPAGVLCYRDDTGRTVAEKLTQRLRFLQSKPSLATFLLMFGILNISYFMYGTAFGIIRATGIATSVACPYPYPEMKTYDPQGYFEREGQAGPFYGGYWNTWMTAQPEGRPKVNPLVENPSCLPGGE